MICSLELYSERFLTPRIYVMYQHLITARTLPSQSLSRPLQRTHSDAHPELIRWICRLLRVRAVSVSPGFLRMRWTCVPKEGYPSERRSPFN